jgi:hypothetical protein
MTIFENDNVPEWPTLTQVRGFLDSDGSYYGRVQLNSNKTVFSFYGGFSISQQLKNADAIDGVFNFLGGYQALGLADGVNIYYHNASLNESGSKAISLNTLKNGPGSFLFDDLVKNPSIAPTKLGDWVITYFLFQAQGYTPSASEHRAEGYYRAVTNLLGPDVCDDKQVANAACLVVRKKMHGAQKNVNPRETKLDTWFDKMNLSSEKRAAAIALGEQIWLTLQARFLNNVSKKTRISALSDGYLSGYHVGDGGFCISIDLNDGIDVKLRWQITDCIEATPLLEAINERYMNNVGLVYQIEKDGRPYSRLMLNGADNIRNSLALKALTGHNYPRGKAHSLFNFLHVLKIIKRRDHLHDVDMLIELVDMKFGMNNDNCGPFSLQTDEASAKDIIENTKRLEMIDNINENFRGVGIFAGQ